MKLKFVGICESCGCEVELSHISTQGSTVNITISHCECYKEEYRPIDEVTIPEK